MSKKTFNLIWGDSNCVREALVSVLDIDGFRVEDYELGYQAFMGDEQVISDTRRVIMRQTGMSYRHIFLANGASGAISILLCAFKKLGALYCITNPAPYFPLYPQMIGAASLTHLTEKDPDICSAKAVVLLDSPANPSGKIAVAPDFSGGCPVILDAVYWNRVYGSKLILPMPNHDVVTGSYSKLLGLNGVRVGWIGTDNDALASMVESLIAPAYCGLSSADYIILRRLVMSDGEWLNFELRARNALDQNREEWSHLERYFAGTPVPVNGMFAWLPVDQAAKKLLEKAGIVWMAGSKCGATDEFGRFNLGQSNKVIREAVAAVLREDKI